MKAIALTIALLVSMSAYASQSYTVRINNKIVTRGMSEQEVRGKIGQPIRTVKLTNGGDGLEYKRGNKLVTVVILGGEVAWIDEQ